MSLAYLLEQELDQSHNDTVCDLQWTARDFVISVGADGSLKQRKVSQSQSLPLTVQGPPPHELGLVALTVSARGDRAIYNSVEGCTKLWDIEGTAILASHESSKDKKVGPAWSVSFSPDGTNYASTGAFGGLSVRSALPPTFGELLISIHPSRNAGFGLNCRHSPDGSKVAVASENGQIRIFDIISQTTGTTLSPHTLPIRSIVWSANGKAIISASEDKRVILSDTRIASSGTVVFTGHASWVTSVDTSPDERLIVSGSTDRTIRVWDIGARASVSLLQEKEEIWATCWYPAATSNAAGAFITGGEGGSVKRWRSGGAT